MKTDFEDNVLQGMAEILFIVFNESNDSKLILLVHDAFIAKFDEFRKSTQVDFEFLRSLIIAKCHVINLNPEECRDRIMEVLKSSGEKESRCNYWSFLF